MAGLNGVTLGENHRAYLGFVAPWLERSNVVFVPSSLFSVWSVLWIGAGATICLALPNCQQWVLQRESLLGRALVWRPNLLWATGLAGLAAVTLASASGTSEFLYFNF